ncbi:hypothetical protein POX_b02389 [Penicillium oxalicum]|nr:hypothetical protein POX_b02389 [Penicillium oxalicum]KAI2792352.1 hypothetical protein POX_b02389 [Penicillium oxalicum]
MECGISHRLLEVKQYHRMVHMHARDAKVATLRRHRRIVLVHL